MPVNRWAVAALLAAGAVACDGTPTGADRVAVQSVVRDSYAPDAPAGATSPPTVTTGQGLTVLGLLQTPNPCRNIVATGTRVGTAVTITVTATSNTQEGCVAMVGSFAYSASLAVPAGTYHVVVWHVGRIGGSPAVARDTTVTVAAGA